MIEGFSCKKGANLVNWLALQKDHEVLILAGTSILPFL